MPDTTQASFASREVDDSPKRPTFLYARRLADCAVWLFTRFSHEYRSVAVIAMIGAFLGTLSQAGGFILAARFAVAVTAPVSGNATSPGQIGVDAVILYGGAALALALVSLGAGLAYFGQKIMIELAVKFETVTYMDALKYLNARRLDGRPIASSLEAELLSQSPRFLGRVLIPLLNAAPASVSALIAIAAGFWINAPLAAAIIFFLILMTPLFVRFTAYTSQTARRMKDSARRFTETKRFVSRRWILAPRFDPERLKMELGAEPGYGEFIDAYQARLKLPPKVQMFSHLSLAAALFIVFFWYVVLNRAASIEITDMLIFLIVLRVFFSGVFAVSTALTTTGTLYPYFSNFISLANGDEIFDSAALHGGDPELRELEG